MTTEEQRVMVAKFMGVDKYPDKNWLTEIPYDSDWGYLMPVYIKFRDLVRDGPQDDVYTQHRYWVGKIIEAIKNADDNDNPLKAFIKLAEAVQWYNNQSKQNV